MRGMCRFCYLYLVTDITFCDTVLFVSIEQLCGLCIDFKVHLVHFGGTAILCNIEIVSHFCVIVQEYYGGSF
jgi:hypothetical protein